MKQYLKFGAEILATIVAGLYAALAGDGVLDAGEKINVVLLALGAVAVLGAGNLPAGVWRYTKGIVAGATAVGVVLASAYTGGIDDAEIAQMVIAFLGAIGVTAVPGPLVDKAIGRHVRGV